MRSLSSLLIVLSCMVAGVPSGAVSAMPEPGTRVRFTARVPERERWIGPFVSVAHDTVTVRDGERNGALVGVPTLHVVRFEISRGNGRNGLRGAGAGFAIGALLGAAVGSVGYSGNDYLVSSAGGSALVGAVVLGTIGAAVGAVIGARSPSEHWHALPLEDLRATARP